MNIFLYVCFFIYPCLFVYLGKTRVFVYLTLNLLKIS
jgi:hypothetical protein